MANVLEFIVSNYVWIMLVAIIILLAIIGSYADKTNFGQGKNIKNVSEEKFDIEKSDIKNMRLGTLLEPEHHILEENSRSKTKNNSSSVDIQSNQGQTLDATNQDSNLDHKNIETNNTLETQNESFLDSESQTEQSSFEENFEKFDKEFDAIIPKKNLIDDELLEDIDSLSLGKTQDLNIDNIPDLDDLELPKIKKIESEEDIWKF